MILKLLIALKFFQIVCSENHGEIENSTRESEWAKLIAHQLSFDEPAKFTSDETVDDDLKNLLRLAESMEYDEPFAIPANFGEEETKMKEIEKIPTYHGLIT